MNPSPKEKIINHCIYCGKNDQLSDEHATPHGLGGKWILRKASCEECRKITSRFEARILKGVLYKYRSYKKFTSRSKYDSLNHPKRTALEIGAGIFRKGKSTCNLLVSICSCLNLPNRDF